MDAGLAVEVEVAEDGPLVAREGEHRQRHGDGHVHAHLPSLDLVDEFPCGAAAAREDGSAVAVRVGVDELNGLVEAVGLDAAQDGPEDFLVVDLHTGLHLAEDRRPHKVAALATAGHRRRPAVEEQLRAVVHARLDEPADALQRSPGDQGANVRPARVARAHPELGRRLDDLGDQLLRLPHEDSDADGHATLARSAATRAHELVHDARGVGVGEDDGVIFGAEVALRALAVLARPLVDVRTRRVAADEGHSAEVLVVAEEVHRVVRAMHDIEHAGGQAAIVRHLRQHQRRHGHPLRRLQQEGVARGDRGRVHPQWDHGGEVERADAADHAKWHPVGVNVHGGGHAGERLALHHRGHARGHLHNLEAPEDVSLGVRDRLALLPREELGELLGVVADGALVLVHDPGPRARRNCAPRLERLRAGVRGQPQLLRRALWRPRDELSGGRVVDVEQLRALRLHPLPVEEHRDHGDVGEGAAADPRAEGRDGPPGRFRGGCRRRGHGLV
mmetsp:Transcript_29542/g.84217  ORF Transcript_29542/g.84217 Transcript_29542/m.84217 type:complete len:503 (-) Transcript_29542:51-1559(-)